MVQVSLKMAGISFVRTQDLLATEQHYPSWADELAVTIAEVGVWTTPILVLQSFLAILDGHHRWTAARTLGLPCIPAVIVDYDDPRLTLSSWRTDFPVTPEIVINAALTGELLPQKTSRHTMSPGLLPVHVALDDLRNSAPCLYRTKPLASDESTIADIASTESGKRYAR